MAIHRSTAMAGQRKASLVLYTLEVDYYQISITVPEIVLRDTFLSKIRNSKTLQPDIVEFDRMREYDVRRTLKWLTESIGRLLARGRMEWARKLQRKSLTSGAIDSDAVPRCSRQRKGR